MILPKYKPKDIPGYEGLYGITKDGKIYNLKYKRFLKAASDKDGYLRINLSKNGQKVSYRVHRLVALTYIPNPNNYPIINHKDENKQNNNVSNLEWCTHKYNTNYGTAIQRQSEKLKGRKFTEEHIKRLSESHKGYKPSEETRNRISKANKGHKTSKETRNKISKANKGKRMSENNHNSKKIICIESGRVFDCISDALEFMGKDRRNSAIGECLKGRTRTAYGYHWEYLGAEDYLEGCETNESL